jgi:hypothetical protein
VKKISSLPIIKISLKVLFNKSIFVRYSVNSIHLFLKLLSCHKRSIILAASKWICFMPCLWNYLVLMLYMFYNGTYFKNCDSCRKENRMIHNPKNNPDNDREVSPSLHPRHHSQLYLPPTSAKSHPLCCSWWDLEENIGLYFFWIDTNCLENNVIKGRR